MSARTTTLALALKIVVLTLLLFICYTVAPLISSLMPSGQTVADPRETAVPLLAMCALQALAISYPIVRSRWTGWRLTVTIFIVFYGVTTFLSQIETVVFLNYFTDIVSTEMIPRLFLNGAIIAALFSPLTVLIQGKIGGATEAGEADGRLPMSLGEWAWKLLLIAVIYVIIYIAFGALVAMPLAGEDFQEYYAGLQLPPWILPFQMVRAMIWTALALPVIQMMKGRWWEAGLAVALLFSILMGSLLLVPTDFMPDAIRRAHLVEVTSSNFLFGWIVVGLLTYRRKPRRR